MATKASTRPQERFPTKADKLTATGVLLESSAAISGIIIALLVVIPELMVPPIVVALIKIAGASSIIATSWSLNNLLVQQQKRWKNELIGPYGILLTALIAFSMAFVLVTMPEISTIVINLFTMQR